MSDFSYDRQRRAPIEVLMINRELCRRQLELDECSIALNLSFFSAHCAHLNLNRKLLDSWASDAILLNDKLQPMLSAFERDFGSSNNIALPLNFSAADFKRLCVSEPQRITRFLQLERVHSALDQWLVKATVAVDKAPGEFEQSLEMINSLRCNYDDLLRQYRRDFL